MLNNLSEQIRECLQHAEDYYQACTTEELPPRLLAALKKLDEETEAAGQNTARQPGGSH